MQIRHNTPMLWRGFRYLVYILSLPAFWMRYRVIVEGLEQVRGLKKTIILPNHPGYVDPPLVMRAIWPTLEPRPMIYEGIFDNILVSWIPKALDGVLVPNLEQHSTAAREQAQRAVAAVVAGLQTGKNHILWPAGRVYRRGREDLGGVRGLSEILSAVPDANIVAIRSRGIWGSRFSYAFTGTAPNLPRRMLQGIGMVLTNLLLFGPRRRVHITIRKVERSELPELSREKVNQFFEDWYNAPGEEKPVFVPAHVLLGPRTYEFPAIKGGADINLRAITPETKAGIAEVLEEKLKRKLTPEEQKPDTKLEAFGLDSLDRMEVSLAIEQRFGFSSDQVPTTLAELWGLAQGMLEGGPPKPPPKEWFNPPGGDIGDKSIKADTIGEAMVRRCLAQRKDIVAADDLSGAVSGELFLIGAALMAMRFEKLAAGNLGIMLPASVATDIAFIAAHLAGKLPVLMNWTTGPANLAHAAKLTKLTHVVTSKKFVDRTGITIEGVQYLFLEDLRASFKHSDQFAAWLLVKFAPGRFLRSVPKRKPEDHAVVLFTSGSEKAPKAVPLTHHNILSNLKMILDTYDVTRADSLVGFLPPFHSFGLTVTTLLPLLAGARVVHHPDPTDAGGIVRKVAAYKTSIICATPTFLQFILDRAKPGDLASLRIAVVGAEKAPEPLFKRFKETSPSAVMLEGYGITECAPLVSANRQEKQKLGSVGLPMPGVEVMLVDPDTLEPLATRDPEQVGMLLVRGPNVFPGYIADPADPAGPPNPFKELNGKLWYITGDLVRIDAEGFIFFAGRLKRFIKAGGEMISLPALEEPLAQKYPPGDEGPRVAVEGIEIPPGGRRIVLFTTEPIELRDANALLSEHGFRGVMRLDEVRKIDKIPTLGTGKTDYKALRAVIEHKQ